MVCILLTDSSNIGLDVTLPNGKYVIRLFFKLKSFADEKSIVAQNKFSVFWFIANMVEDKEMSVSGIFSFFQQCFQKTFFLKVKKILHHLAMGEGKKRTNGGVIFFVALEILLLKRI